MASLFGGSKGSKRSRSTCEEDTDIPIALGVSKPCVCGFCGCKSTDPDPLAMEGDEEAAVPWGKYRKVETASGLVRVPVGNLDSICRNVYRLLGYPHKYGAHAEYLKKVKSKQVDHAGFLSSRDEYIKKQKGGRNRSSKKDKDDLKAVTTLKTMSDMGTRFEGPKMVFIDVNEWDAATDGALDESQVVEEVIGGKTVRGCYKRVGKKGHYDVRSFDQKVLRTETEEHSRKNAKQQFAEESLKNKTEAIQAVFQGNQRDREAVASEGKHIDCDDLLALLANLPGAGSASGQAPGDSGTQDADEAADGDETLNPDHFSTDSGSEDDDAGAAAARLQSLGRKKAKATAKAKSSNSRASTLAGGALNKAAPPVSGLQSVKAAKTASVKASETAPVAVKKEPGLLAAGSVLSLDGRGLRLKESLKKEHCDLLARLQHALNAYDDDYNFTEKKQHAGKQKSLNLILSAVSNQVKRVENSANKSAFSDELGNFEALKALVATAMEFNSALGGTSSNLKALEEGYAQLSPEGLRVGCCFWFKLLETKLEEMILYRNLAGYVGLLTEESYEAGIVRLK
ncbi:unnamed protein product [Symbiodinium natans]|uniref:Uncharacterized protein n=1 Tax=Symbiodinium natans TaxID=878477 RepID=A0A812KJ20_9DINO|nr:unnamed protein product [Symbiodinium natans]